MKKRASFHHTAVLALAACIPGGVAGQGSLLPPGPPVAPAVTLQHLAPATLLPDPHGRPGLAAAPFYLTEPGHYQLDANISLEGATALVIASAFVTLDLGGHVVSITGSAPAETAILVDSAHAEGGVVIRNGTIRGRFERAVYVRPTLNGTAASMVRVEDVLLQPRKTEVTGVVEPSLQGGIILGPLSRIVRCRLEVEDEGNASWLPYPFVEGNRLGVLVGRGGFIEEVELQGAALAAGSGSYVRRIAIHRYSETPRSNEAESVRPAVTLGHGTVARELFIDTGTSVLDAGSAVRLDDVFVSERPSGDIRILSAALITRFNHPAGASGRLLYHDALRIDQSYLRGALVPFQDARYAHLTASHIENDSGHSFTLSLPRGSVVHACSITGGEVIVYGRAGSPLYPAAHIRMTGSSVYGTVDTLSSGVITTSGADLPPSSVLEGNHFENILHFMAQVDAGTLVRRNRFVNVAPVTAGTALVPQGGGLFIVENDFLNLSRILPAHPGVLEKLENTVSGPLETSPVWNADLSPFANTYHNILNSPVP
ncbi:MAG: hypothetical protein JJT96_08050 [Opitutales bacterium]|nr:hypothetical protein [Opitutales bacterium]